MPPETVKPIEPDDLWIVIPARDNAKTVRNVVQRTLKVWPNVVVVDDGSKDASLEKLLGDLPVTVLTHAQNRGKGSAILSGTRYAESRGARFAVTLDADGQHAPEDLPNLLRQVDPRGGNLVIGTRDFSTPNVPCSSRFGRNFSNFWVHLETGHALGDTQSGFRSYPVAALNRLRIDSRAYDFEIEALVKLLWTGIRPIGVPVSVFYPPAGERVSHFGAFRDNLKISLTHLRLILRRLLPRPRFRRVSAAGIRARLKNYRFHPVRFCRMILHENTTPAGLGAAAAVGVFIGVLPVFGFHMAAIVYLCSRLHLNMVVALGIQHFCAPPLVPAACIYIGYFLRHGRPFPSLSPEVVFDAARIWEWILGSLVLAPLGAFFTFIAVFAAARRYSRGKNPEERFPQDAPSRKKNCHHP
jgi:glycosyltransferase involved in cell wall biosynthesis